MKRSQETQETLADGPALKKAKMLTRLDPPENGVESNSAGEWTKVEKRKKKKTAKNEAKFDATQPRFMYSNHEIVKRNHAIAIEDIRDLVLHIISDAPPPNWLRIENGNLIQRVVVLLVPGLTPDLLSLPPLPTSATSNPNIPLAIPLPSPSATGLGASIPFIANTFSHACPTRAPGDQSRMHSVLSGFFHGPVSGEEKKRRMNKKLKLERVKDDPAQYLLTLEQMIENEYPIPSYMADVFQKTPGWLETPEPTSTVTSPGSSQQKQKIYAIDCEMCLTEDGKELTRVCVIDHQSGCVVYDQLVKPSKPIVDYLTRWSGITPEILSPVTTTLEQVQSHILRILSPPSPNPFSTSPSTKQQPPPPTPILIGHSLESDLKALKICHPLCIDTALMYHHPRGRPLKPGLAWLTKKWCGREIQTRGEGGHDPEEDARACLDLLKRKLEEGPGFGEFKADFESIFERMARSRKRGGGGSGGVGSIKSAVVDNGNPAAMHGSKATTAIGCKNDDEVLDGLLNVLPAHDFVYARFMAVADLLGWTTPRVSPDTPHPPPGPPPSPEVLASTLQTLNKHLKTAHAALLPRTAFLVFTGHSDPRRMAQLNSRKSTFENALKSGKKLEDLGDLKWTASDGRDLEEAVELAKRGLLFLGVKS